MENPLQKKLEQQQKEKDSMTRVSMDKSSLDRMFNKRGMPLSSNSASDMNGFSSKSLLANVLDINDDFGLVGTGTRTIFSNNRFKQTNNNQSFLLNRENSNVSDLNFEEASFSSNNPFKKNLYAILKEVRKMTKKIEDDEEDENKILEWRFAAMVIDRLCVVFFTVATFFSTVLILFTSKNFFKLR
jgi:hypothetical protein